MPSQFRQPIQKPSGGLLCPHCGNSFSGEKDLPKEYESERVREDSSMRAVDRYADRGYDAEAGFAEGGRVDGSGEVDGIHTDPAECSHLAAGEVCRHTATEAPAGDDDSFAGYLVKRSSARSSRRAS